MDPGTRGRFAAARVGRLATVTPDGRPHVVVCCFALGPSRVWTPIDRKPKTTRELQRLANVRATGRASLLVDHYEEDWTQLWWVRVDGPAIVLDDAAERELALAALQAKYAQYRADPPDGPVIAITPERWLEWGRSVV